MARKVRCKITGEYGTTDTFFKAENGKWYKSEEIYSAWKEKDTLRRETIGRFAKDFLDYEKGQIFPTALVHQFKQLEYYGWDVINRTIDRCYDKIMYAINTKDFIGDAQKINYIFAIIRNNINDEYKVAKKEKQTLIKNSKIEENCVEDIDVELNNKQSKHKDISRFLEEDEWL